jgi:sterol desaturase/sphingolipid hydroxylase (fatty acid hydroxylase superfamily)
MYSLRRGQVDVSRRGTAPLEGLRSIESVVASLSLGVGGTVLGLVQAIAFGVATMATLLATCIAIERIAPREARVPVADLFPGVLFQILLPATTVLITIPLQRLYVLAGAAEIIAIPLGSWLQPLGVFGSVLWCAFALLLVDFLTYWKHRAEHRWFWPIHAVHHSPTDLHAASSYGHPLQTVTMFLFISIPMSLVQFQGPEEPAAVAALITFLQLFIHSPVDVHFGPLRHVLVEPRYHRIHHSTEPRHLEKNFAITFSFWDRLFGTAYSPAPDEWPDVGVADLAPPETFGQFLFFPLRFLPSGKRPRRRVSSPARLAAGGDDRRP